MGTGSGRFIIKVDHGSYNSEVTDIFRYQDGPNLPGERGDSDIVVMFGMGGIEFAD